MQILLIKSLTRSKWIIPKGWPEAGETGSQTAAREALEEAGLGGTIFPAKIGNFDYKKLRPKVTQPCIVYTYALRVTHQHDDWPERDQRRTIWMPAEIASTQVSNVGLSRIIREISSIGR
jgi:8-oxo-dGTP pyrophosphatase MutT (NUDIX family)